LTIDTTAVAQLLAALVTLLVAAHLLSALFARFRQPRVIGEIAAGRQRPHLGRPKIRNVANSAMSDPEVSRASRTSGHA
jgi:HAMP domain-containing protein